MAANKDIITVKGQVIQVLPNAMFRIRLEETDDMVILGFISGRMRKNNINVKLNDVVDLEMTPYDLTKGRIVYRYK